jgi:5-methyltetrahydrofolate--homocysteine methyltransferase
MTISNFLKQVDDGIILIADGATGTNLQKRGLTPGVPPELWILEKPQEILNLHSDFINAGSDIILTCTFGGSALRLEQHNLGDKTDEINQKAVEIAHKAAVGKPVFIAGSIGPTGKLIQPYGPLDENQVTQNFYDQALILAKSGVDFLLIETQYDLIEAAAAVQGAQSASSLPIVVSFSYDRGTRTMMGIKPEQMAEKFSTMGVQFLGINCGKSLAENETNLQKLKISTNLPIWFKPNAGIPNVNDAGESFYDLEPKIMGDHAPGWVEAGARIIGGCCGSTPEHIKHIAASIKSKMIN